MPKVFNSRRNTVEVGGIYWPGRTVTEHELSADQEADVKAHPALKLDEQAKNSNKSPTPTPIREDD
jgi:hypothetical protein